ncbi:hypothetical protein DPMN_080570 [Dreissena polymorpha]|uniref:Uncharacterized protein n=1 Tax=Dreissena polymorpha TaxID=45954 RepID=A0A9D4BJC7_DREPO|nr:hypothetical protein DPMN_080570 [Dreissena polymorpha]
MAEFQKDTQSRQDAEYADRWATPTAGVCQSPSAATCLAAPRPSRLSPCRIMTHSLRSSQRRVLR